MAEMGVTYKPATQNLGTRATPGEWLEYSPLLTIVICALGLLYLFREVATAGASIIFMIAKSAFGEHLARRAGPLAEKLTDGFRADAFHYLLFLRLVPVFPFFVINLVAALVGVHLPTFIAATGVGIIPGTFTFAFVGAGLDSVIRAQAAIYNACLAAGRADCRLDFDIRAAVTPELLGALAALGVIALIPVAVKRLRARRMANSSG